MKYLWQDYEETKQYCVPREIVEPYSEVQRKNDEGYTEISPLFRFENIFEALMAQEIDENTNKMLQNMIFHFLAQLDFTSGIRDFSVEEYFIEREILGGYYGLQIKTNYSQLSKQEKVKILNLLRKKRNTHNKRSFFYEAVEEIFSNAKLYYYEYERKFLLYIQASPTEENTAKFSLLKDLFFDVTDKIEVFWEQHFGIIGRDETMCMDKMIIY